MIPIVFYEAAQKDIVAIRTYYANIDVELAAQFSQNVFTTTERVQTFPDSGSQRYASPTNIVGLRYVILSNFPYILFYVYRNDQIEVVRCLHTHRDVMSALSVPIALFGGKQGV
jgi:toxin ParE1/3/4